MVRVVALVSVSLLGGCVVASGSRGGGSGGGFFVLLLPLSLFVVFWMVARAGRRRRRAEVFRDKEPVASTQMLRAELSVLADDVVRLRASGRPEGGGP